MSEQPIQGVVSEHYFTAEQGVRQAYADNGDVYVGSTPNDLSVTALPLLTFCVLVFEDGSTVTGETSRDSVMDFDVGLERALARQNARNKLTDQSDVGMARRSRAKMTCLPQIG